MLTLMSVRTTQATERASLATEAAMKAMEEASAATTKASRELEVLMLRTQVELPETLAAVEEASVQWDRLGLEIRDSGRRFGLTNPSVSAASRANGRAPGAPSTVAYDPLLAYMQDGSSGTLGGTGGDLSEQLAIATGMLPGAETVSAAVGRFVEEATQAGAAALANGAVAAAGGMAGADKDVLDASLQALRTWRTRLNRVLDATRDVVAGATTAVDVTAGQAAQQQAALLESAQNAVTQQQQQTRREAGAVARAGGDALATTSTSTDVVATNTQSANSAPGPVSWLTNNLRRVPSAVVNGVGVAGGVVASALSGIKLPGLRRPGDPPPVTADEDEARAERAKAIALALALAEEAAEEARAATVALGQLFNAAIAARGRGATENAAPLLQSGALAGAEERISDISPASLALADEAAALAAAKAAEAAMQEASRASTALLGALAESRAAGDAIEPHVLAALEELPAIVFDDDSYSYSTVTDDELETATIDDDNRRR